VHVGARLKPAFREIGAIGERLLDVFDECLVFSFLS
jgi:hypothetical protein